MSLLSVGYAVLFYLAVLLFVVGLGYRIWTYAKTPVPLRTVVTPAPTTRSGVVWRMAREVLMFESLFKSNIWTWAFSIIYHFGLALVLLRHLRYFIDPTWFWVVLVQPFGVYGGFAMVAGLGGLWVRRFAVDRVRYLSSPSDHLMLAMLVGIGVTGLALKFVARTDIVAVKVYFLGLLRFDIQPLPGDALLVLHLLLIVLLLAVFPFSKLLHAPGLFFAPSRVQSDNAREARHLAAWAAPLDAGRDQ